MLNLKKRPYMRHECNAIWTSFLRSAPNMFFQNEVESKVLLFQNDEKDGTEETNCLYENLTTIYLVIVILTLLASVVLIVYIAMGGLNYAGGG